MNSSTQTLLLVLVTGVLLALAWNTASSEPALELELTGERPPIDLLRTEKTETATFALG